ncbi:MAG TPA: protein-L-isoaspartate(D-aspartate) O-methyltransferase [Gemmatimonadales bacterium]|nr:protein-L-isoaspartate(D-aspartate) O-methyltransferase [Gemmatimonadales bacterium]
MTGPADGYGGYRERLVEVLREKGIRDLAVLHAVAEVPRHLFVPEYLWHRAYDDAALPIGNGQTISQPWVQARSLEALGLGANDTVLEVGTGSGYQTALLSRLAGTVVSIERVRELSDQARDALQRAGLERHVHLIVGDGTLGWPPLAPYAGIVVAAASPEAPAPLLRQLDEGGRLVVPIGGRESQVLTLVTRRGEEFGTTALSDARFVPLIGQHGWN